MQRTLVLFSLLLAATACSTTSSTQQPPDPSTKPASPSDGDGEQDPGGEVDAGLERSDASGAGATGPTLPSGSLCDSDTDCDHAQVCEGVGCEASQGRCVDNERICTRDLAEYCGCAGQAFKGSGSCPGARFAYRGPCEPALEEGEACTDGRQCRSGQCLGEGLEGCTKGARGVCGESECTADLAAYCGCNNTEFRASGSCPERQFAYRGPCES